MNIPQICLTITNLFEYKTKLYQNNLIFFVSLLYSVPFSVVDVLTSKGHFFLKQINSETLFWIHIPVLAKNIYLDRSVVV